MVNANTRTVIDLFGCIRSLSARRPVFHSEADFQHALAWELQTNHPSCQIRLEYRHPALPGRGYLDIVVFDGGQATYIELKYKKKRSTFLLDGERFDLLEDGAVDLGRYDFLKDVVRVEATVAHDPRALGYAVLLTNEPKYWNQPPSVPDTIDAMFRVHEAAVLRGSLTWSERAGGTTKGREAALELRRDYVTQWHDYSAVQGANGRFRFVCLDATDVLP